MLVRRLLIGILFLSKELKRGVWRMESTPGNLRDLPTRVMILNQATPVIRASKPAS
jgi:hypothetical protein